eukprot:3339574-Prymnesium_polylepis.1
MDRALGQLSCWALWRALSATARAAASSPPARPSPTVGSSSPPTPPYPTAGHARPSRARLRSGASASSS